MALKELTLTCTKLRPSTRWGTDPAQVSVMGHHVVTQPSAELKTSSVLSVQTVSPWQIKHRPLRQAVMR